MASLDSTTTRCLRAWSQLPPLKPCSEEYQVPVAKNVGGIPSAWYRESATTGGRSSCSPELGKRIGERSRSRPSRSPSPASSSHRALMAVASLDSTTTRCLRAWSQLPPLKPCSEEYQVPVAKNVGGIPSAWYRESATTGGRSSCSPELGKGLGRGHGRALVALLLEGLERREQLVAAVTH